MPLALIDPFFTRLLLFIRNLFSYFITDKIAQTKQCTERRMFGVRIVFSFSLKYKPIFDLMALEALQFLLFWALRILSTNETSESTAHGKYLLDYLLYEI